MRGHQTRGRTPSLVSYLGFCVLAAGRGLRQSDVRCFGTAICSMTTAPGREERTGDRFGLGRECELLGQLGLELDGRQPTESVLCSLAVIFPLDPDDDGESQLLPGGPPLLVEDVRLQQ